MFVALRILLLAVVLVVLVQASIFDTLKAFLTSAGNAGAGAAKHVVKDDPIAYPQLSQDQYESLRFESLMSLKQGKAKESISPLLTILESDPMHAESNMIVGTTLLNELKRPDLAESFLYRAVTGSEWRDLIGISNLAIALTRNNDVDLAEKVANEGIRVNADGNGSYDAVTTQDVLGQVLGLINVQRMDYVAASEWYFAAATAGSTRSAVKADNINVWLKAATLEFPPEHFNANVAKSALLEAMKYHPMNAELVYNMGLTHHKAGETEMAISFYQQALELDKAALIATAQASGEKENVEFNAAHTSIPSAWGALGTVLFSEGKLQEAHDCFEQAFQIQPNNQIMLANWAKLLCLETVGHYEEGKLIADRAYQIMPSDGSVVEAVAACSNRNR